jgi:hypothetical protein
MGSEAKLLSETVLLLELARSIVGIGIRIDSPKA